MKAFTLKLFLLLAVVTLPACDLQPVRQDSADAGDSLVSSEHQLSLYEEAERLLGLAEDSDNTDQQQVYRAKAARLFIEAGDVSSAKQQRDILQQLGEQAVATDATAARTLSITTTLLSAEIAIAEHQLVQASTLLAGTKPVSRQQQIDYYTAKANLDYLSARYMDAVERRVQLDNYINDPLERRRNNQKIWTALSSMPSAQLKKQRSKNPTIDGWLDLARVMRSGQHDISQLEDKLLDWGTRHPQHPVGEAFLSELIDGYQADTRDRKHIAVILPLQGKLSTVSDTIKNGILSAYYSDSDSTLKPVVRFYDNADESTTYYQLFQQAMDDGATNIIGPLNKTTINQLAQQSELDIPVLTLNYAENELNQTDNLFQFGLSPMDEARQVAELAIQQNRMRAAVFYPDSEWGKRLRQAFSDHYVALGGRIVSDADYATNTNDYRRPIRAMLNIDQSSIRRRKVENIIGAYTKYEAYRRQDIDMIFLAATHRSARGIMPAFKFHHAGDVPVYSTSHVYSGTVDRDLDRDLNGLIFCDMPWILQNTSPLAKTFEQNWPQQQSFTRLFALGVDAYHLIYNLDYLQNRDYAFYAGLTGNIQLTASNRVTRKLLWAKFKSGKPVLFEPEIMATEKIASKK